MRGQARKSERKIRQAENRVVNSALSSVDRQRGLRRGLTTA